MSIKIKNIIPVTGAVVTPEMIAHIGKYLSPDSLLPPKSKWERLLLSVRMTKCFAVRISSGYAKKVKTKAAMPSSSTAMAIRR